MRLLLTLVLALAACAPPARAQDLVVRGGEGERAAALLREITGRGAFVLIERDTVLPASTRIEGDLVVSDATVRLAGAVAGDVALLNGHLFIRPGARVDGRIVVAGGELYPSRLASTGEVIRLAPEITVRRDGSDGADGGRAYDLVRPAGPPALALDGVSGIGLPSYDRVNGVTARLGGRLRLGPDDDGALVRGAVAYYSARGELGGEAALEAPLGAGTWLVAEATRRSATNERWIRGDLANSLAALFLRSDARDYYETDELSLSLVRRPEQALIQGESWLGPRLSLRASRDRSLRSREPWTVLGDEWRPNPAIAEGTLASVVAGLQGAWRGQTARFDGDLAVEWAPPEWGDFEFAQLVAEGGWQMMGLWGHQLQVYGRTHQTLGSREAPPQRWSFVGGGNTLPVLDYGALRGDRLVFVRSVYLVPLTRLELPLLGPPALRVVHAVGTAWTTSGESARWEQNLGLGVAFSLLDATLYIDPAAESPRPQLHAGLSLPF